jgi:hypothetical protein
MLAYVLLPSAGRKTRSWRTWPDSESAPPELRAYDRRPVEVTILDAGKRLHARILGANIDVTKRLSGDLPAEDLATTARLLAAVLERADIELTRDSSAAPLAGSLEWQSPERPAR